MSTKYDFSHYLYNNLLKLPPCRAPLSRSNFPLILSHVNLISLPVRAISQRSTCWNPLLHSILPKSLVRPPLSANSLRWMCVGLSLWHHYAHLIIPFCENNNFRINHSIKIEKSECQADSTHDRTVSHKTLTASRKAKKTSRPDHINTSNVKKANLARSLAAKYQKEGVRRTECSGVFRGLGTLNSK